MATLSVGGQLVATNDTLSNAVQDNITRLGTVTAGTIGTAVIYPTGHILQSIWAGSKDSISTTSESPVAIAQLECILTARQTNGKFLCTFIGGKVDDNSPSGQVAAYLYKSENTGAYGRVDDPTVATFEAESWSGNYANTIAFCYQYNATITAGQNIKFMPYFESSNDATVSYVNHVGFISLTVQEIQL